MLETQTHLGAPVAGPGRAFLRVCVCVCACALVAVFGCVRVWVGPVFVCVCMYGMCMHGLACGCGFTVAEMLGFSWHRDKGQREGSRGEL